MQKISNSDIIVAISPNMETFIKSPYKDKPECQKWIMLENYTELLDIRNIGEWGHDNHGHDNHGHDNHGHDNHEHDKHGHDNHAHDNHEHDNHGHDNHGHNGHNHHAYSKDYHIWLSPEIMIQSAKNIKDILIASSPSNEKTLNKNYQNFVTKLSAKSKIVASFFENKEINFVVFHDAFQYFEKEYGLNTAGSMTGNLGATSAKQHKKLIDKIKKENVSCIVFESQTGRAEKLAKQLGITPVAIDLLGSNITKDSDFYFNYIDSIANSFLRCIKN